MQHFNLNRVQTQYIFFTEWEIGSEPETDDVFPRIKVGITDSRKAFIKDGKLWIDETPLNTSVGEFANKSWSNESVHEAQSNTFFVLEPGKCVYVTLYAVGRSHLSSTVQSDPLCIKREYSEILTGLKIRIILIHPDFPLKHSIFLWKKLHFQHCLLYCHQLFVLPYKIVVTNLLQRTTFFPLISGVVVEA